MHQGGPGVVLVLFILGGLMTCSRTGKATDGVELTPGTVSAIHPDALTDEERAMLKHARKNVSTDRAADAATSGKKAKRGS
jgi:hypothetical protein